MATAQQHPTPRSEPVQGPKLANPGAHLKIEPKKEPSALADKRKRMIVIASAVVALLVIGLSIYFWKGRTHTMDEPPYNADTIDLVKFIASKRYEALPFERQRVWMRVIEKREDKGDLKDLYRKKLITSTEYRTALGEAWLGKKLNRVENYNETVGIQQKMAFLKEVYDKKHDDDDEPKAPKVLTTPTGEPLEKVKVDKQAEEARLNGFPQEVRDQYHRYEKDYKKAKKQFEAAEEANSKKAAPAATKPAVNGK